MIEASSEDFPAAHSMDTEWFAVDDEGRVAVLQTHENGAILHDFPEKWRAFFFPSDLFLDSEGKYGADGLQRFAWPGDWIMERAASLPAPDMTMLPERFSGVFELADDAALPSVLGMTSLEWRQQINDWNDFGRFAGARAVYALDRIPRDRVLAAVATGQLLGMRIWRGNFETRREFWADLFGIYRFAAEGNWGVRYDRARVPPLPATVQTMPAALAEALAISRLPASDFASMAALYPAMYARCWFWNELGFDVALAGDEAGQVALFHSPPEDKTMAPWMPHYLSLQQLLGAWPRGADGIAHLAADGVAWLEQLSATGIPVTGNSVSHMTVCLVRDDALGREWFGDKDYDVFRFAGDAPLYLVDQWGRDMPKLLADPGMKQAWEVDRSTLYAMFGFYDFAATDEGARTYKRHAVPLQPCKVEDLPEAIRSNPAMLPRLAGVRFDEIDSITADRFASPAL